MSIQTILRLGNPLLHERSIEVDHPDSAEIHNLVEDMFDTMRNYEGAGLAAPQIGIMKRVIIFGFESNPRYPDAEPVPETVLINPVIEQLGSEVEKDWEGCLSIPGMRGMVTRPTHIRYSGYTQHGDFLERDVTGFHARVVLHECDHLDGILYVQRIKDMREYGFIEELEESLRFSPLPCDTCEIE